MGRPKLARRRTEVLQERTTEVALVAKPSFMRNLGDILAPP